MALETQKQANKTAENYCRHKFYPRWRINGLFRIHLSFSFGHMYMYISRYYIEVR